ncbi:MAG: PQQ-dependent sugar dehydrogenase [Planctomycetaceae bacterium]
MHRFALACLMVLLLLATFLFSANRFTNAGRRKQTAARKTTSKQREHSTKPFGLSKRIPWTTSRLKGSPYPPSPYKLERVFGNLKFQNPVVLTNAPASDRMFVVQLDGKIFSFPQNGNIAQPDLMVDLKKEINGLTRAYGLTFHPKFKSNRYCYVSYVLKNEDPQGTRVSRFKVRKTNPPTLDPQSEKIIITWKSGGHNGACLKFGPDGFLYISTGDGAGAFPPDSLDTGQNINDLLASILRIDVDHPANGKAYSIPKDNPFVNTPNARGEIWSYGHRNPWKMSFDSVTGDLWVGDVGWEMWEMIYRIQRGGNYGWSLVEASQQVHPERQRGPSPVLPPTIVHSHTESRSITGGFVYRGKRLPELNGHYIYGDYVTGKIWSARHDGKSIVEQQELLDSPLQVICFGVDNSNELYVVGYGGTIHRLVKNEVVKANENFPRSLKETGLFANVRKHRIAPGVIPYSIIAEAWADGTQAERFVALPGTTQLDVHTENNAQVGNLRGEWKYPNNSVLMKTIFIELEAGNPNSRRRIETQVLHRDGDVWRPYNFIWNDDQTDAKLAPDVGMDRTFVIQDAKAPGGQRRQTWHHASRTECLLCHPARAGTVHAFKPAQLDKVHDYGSVTANQLGTFDHIGLIKTHPPNKRKRFVNPHDSSAPLEARARAYLHVNCAHCHRRGGGGTAAMELPYQLPMEKTNLLNARPTQGTFKIHGAQVLAPGDPFRSVLYYRMAKLGRGRMPHFGSNVVDQQGLQLIREWILRMPSTGTKTATSKSTQQLRARQKELLKQLANITSAQSTQLAKVVQSLLSSTSGAMLLADQLASSNRLNNSVRKQIVSLAVKHPEAQIRDLFERFLPEEQRIKRLGTVVDAKALLNQRGNVERGRKLFFQTTGISCINCHKIQGKGKEIGPDLSHIARQRKRADILESILHPSRKIEEKYRLYLVETTQGKVLTGLLASQSKSHVVLLDAKGQRIKVPKSNVETLVPQRKSIMPELLLRDLTAEQATDLLEFLSSLK